MFATEKHLRLGLFQKANKNFIQISTGKDPPRYIAKIDLALLKEPELFAINEKNLHR